MKTSAPIADVVAVVQREIKKGKGSESDENQRRAARLERELACFTAGQAGQIPAEWQGFANRAMKEADPDFSLYQQLKAKFGI